MRIAVVTSTCEFGGAESIDIHTLRRLCLEGDEVEVAMPAEGALRGHLEAIGARCRVIESGRALEGLSRRYGSARAVGADALWAAAAYQRALGQWLSALGADGVLAMGFRAQLALSVPATARRIPSAWIASDFVPTDTLVCRAWSMLARHVPRIVITYSRAAAAQGALRGARTCVVPPGIEHERFPLGPERREPLLAFVGHLTPLKNHLGFIDVLRRVREAIPETRGIIAGRAIYRTGPHAAYAERVRTAVEAFGDPVALRLLEYSSGGIGQPSSGISQPSSGIGELLRRAAVLVHLSMVPETFGLVCVEAMASGCPVVGFRRGATPEVLGDAGVLVAPDDLPGAARACVALLADEQRRVELLRRGRERALTNFSAETSGVLGARAIRAALRSAAF
jgi:glycosyltransferase involved in cell wall biosynthesis